MHPILARPSRLALYLGVWLPVGILLAGMLAQARVLPLRAALTFTLPLSLLYAFMCLAAWYLCHALPLRASAALPIAASFAVGAVVSSGLWVWMGQGWAAVLREAGAFPDGGYAASAPLLFVAGVLLFLLAMAVHYLLVAYEESRQAERRGFELAVLAREAELKALRAQIDPHFLFNSLNSISALTTADPAAARRMCLQLAQFFRDGVALGARDRIALEQELTLARHFLAIEQVRFGARLQVDVVADAEAARLAVPPLLLQPLVENAVTHGIATLLEGGMVRIAARRAGDDLIVAVENPADPDRRRKAGTGVGLSNVKRRLEALYGHDARMDVVAAPGRFTVELRFPAAVMHPAEGTNRHESPAAVGSREPGALDAR